MLVDVATVLAAGGEAIADIDTLRHHDGLSGRSRRRRRCGGPWTRSPRPGWSGSATARAKVRRHVWSLLPAGLPPAPVAGTDLGDVVVLDVDATLVTAHSEKEQAAANFKGGFGFHPLGVWCDNTGELLAIRLRPGNANANHAGDHIDLLGEAIGQIPAGHRRSMLVRADSAGASHQLLDWLTEQGQVRGRRWSTRSDSPSTKGSRSTTPSTPCPSRRGPTALDADGEVRDGAQVAEITGLLDLHEVAGRDAGHRPPGEAAPRRRADLVRAGRRLALPSLRHQHRLRPARRSWRPGTGPTPGSRTGSGSRRTPVSAGSRRGSSRSTRCGSRSPRSPPT